MKNHELFTTLPRWLQEPSSKYYLSNNFVVLDYENTIIDGDGSPLNPLNDIVLYVWYEVRDGLVKRKHCIGGIYSQQELFDDLNNADFVVAHNAKHELQWLHRGGYPIHKLLVFDTMLAERVLAGNRPWPLALDPVSKKYGGSPKNKSIHKLMGLGVCPSSMHTNVLLRYCDGDVYNTYITMLAQRELLQKYGLLNVFLTRCILTPFLAELEFTGCKLDGQRIQEAFKEIQDGYNTVSLQLIEEFGDINYRSGPQVARLLYDELGFAELKDKRGNPIRNKPSKQFPDGVPLTDKDSIAMLKAKNKRQARFLELKQEQGRLNAMLTKTLLPFKRCVEESDDKILRFVYNQHIARTHRLTSTGTEFSVQGQNMSNKFKRLITSRNDDYYVWEADYSKLEFNVASVLGNDKVAQQEVVNGFDVHKYTGAIIKVADEYVAAKKEIDIDSIMHIAESRLGEIDKESRRLAKPFTFGPLTNIADVKLCELRGSL